MSRTRPSRPTLHPSRGTVWTHLQVVEPCRLLLRHGHRDRVPAEVGHGVPEVLEQQGSQIPADTPTDQNALYGYVGSHPGEGVGRHLPPSCAEPVGQVEQGITRVLTFAYAPRDGRDPGGRVAVTEKLEGAQLDDLGREVLTDLIGRVVDRPVSLTTESKEVVVLNDHLPGWTREVDLKDRHVSAQVVHVKDQLVGELLAVPPDDPTDAQRRQPELVPRSADRLDPRQAKVEDHVGCAKGSEEGATGPIHVYVDIEAGLGLQLVKS